MILRKPLQDLKRTGSLTRHRYPGPKHIFDWYAKALAKLEQTGVEKWRLSAFPVPNSFVNLPTKAKEFVIGRRRNKPGGPMRDTTRHRRQAQGQVHLHP